MRSATVFFRIAVSIHVLLLLAQPMLVGLFLSGGDEAKLRAHEMVGSSVGATGLVLLVAAVVAWRRAEWPARIVVLCLLLVVAEVVQLTMGYDRHLGIHVPLGVLLAITVSFLHAWAYRPHGQFGGRFFQTVSRFGRAVGGVNRRIDTTQE